MRLTILAACVVSLIGCAGNVSDTHLTPKLVSTAPKKPASPVKDVVFGEPLAPSQPLNDVVLSQPAKALVQDKPLMPSQPAKALVQDEPAKATAQDKPAKVSQPKKPEQPDLTKQFEPHYPYLRVTKLLPGRLRFDNKTHEFIYRIQAGTLSENISTLLTAADGAQLQFNVDQNHRFPNEFEIRGQTVAHLIDQMVGPFKTPGQVWQNVHINNLIVIGYSRRMASNAG